MISSGIIMECGAVFSLSSVGRTSLVGGEGRGEEAIETWSLELLWDLPRKLSGLESGAFTWPPPKTGGLSLLPTALISYLSAAMLDL
jgi:hypothetical protein